MTSRVGPQLNWRLILPIMAAAVLAAGVGMLICFFVALADGDPRAFSFGVPAALIIPAALAIIIGSGRLKDQPLRPRDGFLAVTLAWVAASALGTLPFLLYGTFDNASQAFFESMSGFTTTGATLLNDIESQPPAILLWRSLSQWFGGVGIVVLVVAVAPATGLAMQKVFYAEMSGITAERLTPRIAETAKILLLIYGFMTVAGFLAYLLVGLNAWDAVNHVFTTVATGGFSTHTASFGYFDSVGVEIVAIIFMAAGGVNFVFYWRALHGRKGMSPQFSEVRAYLLILVGATTFFTAALILIAGDEFWDSLRAAGFTVTSIVTTTGYVTSDFDAWPDLARVGLLMLMLVGGCAGSTSGGMKVIRVMLLAKTAAQEVTHQMSPNSMQVLRLRGKVFSEESRRGVLGFFCVYIIVLASGTLIMMACGLDPMTATSSAVASLGIVGPAFGGVGAIENYSTVPPAGLWTLSALMLIGRLEVFTVLALLTPAFWRRKGA